MPVSGKSSNLCSLSLAKLHVSAGSTSALIIASRSPKLFFFWKSMNEMFTPNSSFIFFSITRLIIEWPPSSLNVSSVPKSGSTSSTSAQMLLTLLSMLPAVLPLFPPFPPQAAPPASPPAAPAVTFSPAPAPAGALLLSLSSMASSALLSILWFAVTGISLTHSHLPGTMYSGRNSRLYDLRRSLPISPPSAGT